MALAATVVRLRTATTTGRGLACRAAERHASEGRIDVAAEFAAVWRALDVEPAHATGAVYVQVNRALDAPGRNPALRLTRGQQRVLAGFASGRQGAVVARMLGLAPTTIKTNLEQAAAANSLPSAGSADIVAAFLRDGWDLGHPENLPDGWWPTPGETRVLDAMLAGHVRNDQIAAELYVSVNTVKTVLTRLRTTLGPVSRAGLIAAWVHLQRGPDEAR